MRRENKVDETHSGNQLDLCQNGKKLGHLLFLLIPFMPFPKAQSPSSSIIWRGEPGNRPLKNRFRGNIVGESFIYIFRIRSGFLPTLSSYTTRPVSDPIAQAALPSSLPARKAHKRKE